MAYRILEFRCGTDRAQGYVLQGSGEHEGTTEQISVEEMHYFAHDGTKLAWFLDTRFLLAHGERIRDTLSATGGSDNAADLSGPGRT